MKNVIPSKLDQSKEYILLHTGYIPIAKKTQSDNIDLQSSYIIKKTDFILILFHGYFLIKHTF